MSRGPIRLRRNTAKARGESDFDERIHARQPAGRKSRLILALDLTDNESEGTGRRVEA